MPFPPELVSPHQIVVASDLTDIAVLLPHVVAQAKATNASVTLVHAARNSTMKLPSTGNGDAVAQEEAYAKRLLSGMKHTLEIEGIPCTIVVKPGLAGVTVRKEIDRIGAGRLIIGAHTYGPCGPIMIGATANALLAYSSVPICVIGPMMSACSEHTSPKRVLHPVAASGIYQERARFAAEIAQTYGAELTLLHVIPPSNTASLYAHDIETSTRSELESLELPPGLRVRVIMKYGDRLEEILTCASAEDMDLIIMGMSHEYHWWSTQNNLAHKVIAESLCPVLTFRDRILTPNCVGPSLPAESSIGLS